MPSTAWSAPDLHHYAQMYDFCLEKLASEGIAFVETKSSGAIQAS